MAEGNTDTARPSVVFFGSGPVAAKSLQLLLAHQAVEAIVTKPSTVREMQAAAPEIPIYTAKNKQGLDELVAKTTFSSTLAVLIDFGIIVSKKVIDSFELGIINSHFSLLPQWRGADPITFSILSGQEKTGVSLMVLDEGMDTGKIITQKSLIITSGDTAISLTEKLINLSDTLLATYLPRYQIGDVKPRQQPHPERATYSRKLTKEDGILDFTKPAKTLEREIRAFLEWPKSRTEIAGKDVVALKASTNNTSGAPGKIFKTTDKKIGIHCADGTLVIEELKPAGKPAMTSQAFLAGHTI